MTDKPESPVKVSKATHERLRLAAVLTGRQQQELLDEAVGEYVVRHKDEFEEGLQRAREALMNGTAPEYLAGAE